MYKSAVELEALLYNTLKSSPTGVLSFDEVINVMDTKSEYGFRRIQGEAMRTIRERPDVVQLRDERDRPYLKLV